MRKVLIIALALAGTLSLQKANAQARIAYVDTEYILEQMTEYRSSQKKLDDLAEQWKKEVDTRSAELEKMWTDYQAQWVVLPDADKKKREEEISRKEKELNEFKQQKFGPEGELFKKRQELIRPIQDKVFNAIQQLAKERALDMIFDKSGAVTMLFTNPKYDMSDDVLEILGVIKQK